MRVLSLALSFALVLSTAACGGDDDGVADEDIVLLDNSSDEVVLTLRDLVDRGEVTVDDDLAAQLTSPADGDELAADTAPTFTWTHPQSDLRHGRDTGAYVWLHITGPGMDAPIDLAAIESTSWEVDDESWELLRSSTGPCQVEVYSAYVDRGVAEEVLRPSSSPSFSVAE